MLILTYIFCLAGVYILSLLTTLRSSKKLFRTFGLFSFSIGTWVLTQFIADQGSQHVLTWFRLGIFISCFMASSFILFSFYYPAEPKLSPKLKIVVLLPILIFAPLSFTDLIINNAVNKNDYIVFTPGPLYATQTLLLIIYFVGGIVNLVIKLKSQTPSLKKQYLFLIIAFTIPLIPNIVIGYFYPDVYALQVVRPLSILFMVAMIYYAIVFKSLFDIRLIVARSLAYILTLSSILIIYAAIIFQISSRYLDKDNLRVWQNLFVMTAATILAISFQPIKRRFDKFTNSIFYRDAYDSQEFLNKINSNLVSEIDLYKLLTKTAEEVNKNLKTEFCNFYVDEKATIDFHTVGTNIKIFADESWGSLFKTVLNSQKKIISEIGEDENLKTLLSKCNIGAIIKMESQDQYVGYLVVGIKKSGNAYSNQDLQILEIIADEVAIAAQNTLRFEEIAQFNITLQKRIEDATARLQKTNEKLVALDEAKDEFISMASHQLRTPLTSIKGYLSMLQEGDAGELNEQQHNFVDQAFLSSQRMVYLIADLLNVSRLKTGKFVIEAKPTYLPDVVEGEIKQLAETAKARDLEMVFNKPTDFPMMNLDETKIRQVIMNFADNAVYYTPNGGKITIQLKADENNVIYSVTDTGIGVPKSEQHKLFTKFYRAGNARKARPDGTGLGLFMAKKVVVAQGGAIIFKTQEGKGSTFGFSFPRAKLELKDVPKPSTQ